MIGPRASLCYGLLWLASVFSVVAHPTDATGSPDQPARRNETATTPTFLRIMCLGASIMQGYLSTDNNGMRWALRSALVADGHGVNMVGSQKVGTMGDNDNEAWPGYRIADVSAKAALTIPQMPNVVVVLVGSNDIIQGYYTSTMDVRIGALIDNLFNNIPGVTVVVSTLPPNGNATVETIEEVYNANITNVVNARQNLGRKVSLVDAHSPWWSTADLIDGLHPTNAGYIKLARVFYDGIKAARGTITPPINTGISDASPADPTTGKDFTLPLPVDPYFKG